LESHFEVCTDLSDQDRDRIAAVEDGLSLTADVSRADLLLFCLLDADRALVVRHAAPASAASLYREDATASEVGVDEQPLVLRVLQGGRGGRLERVIKDSRAPVVQDVLPVYNDDGDVIGALAIEFNMFAYERHRQRSRIFQDAHRTLLQMCARGEMACTSSLTRFGVYDGIYSVNRGRTITYMSGVAGNLFRGAGVAVDVEGQSLSELEPMDAEVTDSVFATGRCVERRNETQDGRIWVRKGIPLRAPPDPPSLAGIRVPWHRLWRRHEPGEIQGVLVLLHNATETVQRQRELNVKSAIIQEVHHRVKNNLQSVAAILRIQARRAEHEETRQQLNDAVNRILSVAVIHEFLGEGDERLINIRDLADRMAGQVGQVTGNPDQEIAIRVHGPRIRLPAGQATPVAMVINELMLNAVEHGLQGYRNGRIEITLEDLGQSVRVTVENSGSGLPPDFDPQVGSSLGLQIVYTLVTDDLKGEMTIESLLPHESLLHGEGNEDVGSGTRAVVTFPKRSLRVD
jgi:two-component system, sensor histidine kinase PdtaS